MAEWVEKGTLKCPPGDPWAVEQCVVAVLAVSWVGSSNSGNVEGLGDRTHWVSPATADDAAVWANAGIWVTKGEGDALDITATNPPQDDLSMLVTIGA